MDAVYNMVDFDDQNLKCENCGWQGKGSDAIIIDLYGISKMQEIHCPNCDHYLGGLKTDGGNDSVNENPDEFTIG